MKDFLRMFTIIWFCIAPVILFFTDTPSPKAWLLTTTFYTVALIVGWFVISAFDSQYK